MANLSHFERQPLKWLRFVMFTICGAHGIESRRSRGRKSRQMSTMIEALKVKLHDSPLCSYAVLSHNQVQPTVVRCDARFPLSSTQWLSMATFPFPFMGQKFSEENLLAHKRRLGGLGDNGTGRKRWVDVGIARAFELRTPREPALVYDDSYSHKPMHHAYK
ncbi:hypothetical protein BGY98DRAFT_6837 [Russula aff. rugulosa BPL654]|nr:hypothetical protein BGY98DRAFT_6837 [Russula aff. rugulosa BPL654]